MDVIARQAIAFKMVGEIHAIELAKQVHGVQDVNANNLMVLLSMR